MTIPCTLALLLHTQPISRLGRLAAETTLSGSDLSRLRIQLVADAGVRDFPRKFDGHQRRDRVVPCTALSELLEEFDDDSPAS
jgi:hypothetical protein